MKMTPERRALRLLERTVAKSDRFKLEKKANQILRSAIDNVALLSDECPSVNSYLHIADVWRRVAKRAKQAQAKADLLLGPPSFADQLDRKQ